MLKEFKKFILRGNLVDLAIGFTVGASFSTVAKSIVDDILMPPIGLLLGNADFSDLFIILREGTPTAPYDTLANAEAAGAITLNYGLFINNIISLLVVALAMFVAIKAFNTLQDNLDLGDSKNKDETPTHKKCPECLSKIPYKATRCAHCTTKLQK